MVSLLAHLVFVGVSPFLVGLELSLPLTLVAVGVHITARLITFSFSCSSPYVLLQGCVFSSWQFTFPNADCLLLLPQTLSAPSHLPCVFPHLGHSLAPWYLLSTDLLVSESGEF